MNAQPTKRTMIFFYTGTGNSLWAARFLALKLQPADIVPIPARPDDGTLDEADAIGFVFPVHVWGIPRKVVEFIRQFPENSNKYYFAIAVNGGQVAATLVQLRGLLSVRGNILSAGYDLPLISNYIPWGGPGPEEQVRAKIQAAEKKLVQIAATIRGRSAGPIEKGPWWQNIPFSCIYRLTFRQIPTMDKEFWTDEKCNGCRICQTVCTHDNIEMTEDRPRWLHTCGQCFACLQWCPQQAIQYGRRTPRYDRYHHPEIHLDDMLSVARRIRQTQRN